ncbi:YceI family protein [Natronogracilivirga saccharolytica]|uniref:YceI family protein n=1 Tax=Natronogracilivirga saccharolytica TaxID=2812953 RepID=A0A8J7UUR9_9BACT|nr:YceI family protein [Natronogracilivirga saccharolytica]MBP3191807.1 YceI family protein [Natronogracilivirga saccharolytica]
MSTLSEHTLWTRSLLLSACFLFFAFSEDVSGQVYFETHVDSKLWLEGSSSVHSFDCVAMSIEGTAYMENYGTMRKDPDIAGQAHDGGGPYVETSSAATPAHLAGNAGSGNSNEGSRTDNHASGESAGSGDQPGLNVNLKVPIESFDCGRSRMNRDMYEALKSDEYEYITFDFEKADPIEENGSKPDSLFAGDFRAYTIEGTLNVAGVDRKITLITQGRSEGDGRYRVKGHKEISMHDFDIEPPTALGGLIRAHEDLTVFFDLIVLAKQDNH